MNTKYTKFFDYHEQLMHTMDEEFAQSTKLIPNRVQPDPDTVEDITELYLKPLEIQRKYLVKKIKRILNEKN